MLSCKACSKSEAASCRHIDKSLEMIPAGSVGRDQRWRGSSQELLGFLSALSVANFNRRDRGEPSLSPLRKTAWDQDSAVVLSVLSG
jgi:hypothetical protein